MPSVFFQNTNVAKPIVVHENEVINELEDYPHNDLYYYTSVIWITILSYCIYIIKLTTH